MIITFYSYKGGVGRTQLLANVASYLCYHKNKKILLLEWDLEAPGLHFYFGKENEDVQKDGLIEILERYTQLMREKPDNAPIAEKELPIFTKANIIENLTQSKKGGRIDLIPCANYSNDTYTKRINAFDWITFMEKLDGNAYIKILKDSLNALPYDLVFVDSRTGIADYSGLCNILLPDMNVMVIAPTKQNFSGSKRIADAIYNHSYRKDKHRKPYMLPVLSRIDEETDAQTYEYWLDTYKDYFGFMLETVLDDTLKPLAPFLFRDVYEPRTTLHYNRTLALGENILFSPEARPSRQRTQQTFESIALFIDALQPDEKEPQALKTLDFYEFITAEMFTQWKEQTENIHTKIAIAKAEMQVSPESFLNLEDKELTEIPAQVGELVQLRTLILSHNQITDISPLQNLKQLKRLDLAENHIVAIDALQHIEGLEYLNISRNPIQDMSCLSNLKEIKELWLIKNNLTDIQFLAELHSIEYLRIGLNNLTDITPIQHLKNIHSLNIGRNNIISIEAIKNLVSIEDFYMVSNHISDISALENLTNMHSLNISNNQISDISVLENLNNINSLYMSNNQISDISSLKNLTNIHWLDMVNNQVSDISVLENLTNMGWLNIANNQVSDISVLGNLIDIHWLHIANNQISDISILVNLTNLYTLDIANNHISDITVLLHFSELNELILYGNPIPEAQIVQIRDAFPMARIVFTQEEAKAYFEEIFENHWDEEEKNAQRKKFNL